ERELLPAVRARVLHLRGRVLLALVAVEPSVLLDVREIAPARRARVLHRDDLHGRRGRRGGSRGGLGRLRGGDVLGRGGRRGTRRSRRASSRAPPSTSASRGIPAEAVVPIP